ncbi:hypothetical protein GTQ40_11430 [Flavobacteriaceae bacterium R38]|nr:hypothetical protein [Flavobacteriaceae bacterium R38]
MRKLSFLITMISIAFLSSCNFTEELHIKENGSGRISIHFDGSELMKLAGDKINTGGEEVVDSIISFKELLEEKKDSIANLSLEEQERLKKLEKFTMHMVVNESTGDMKMDFYTDFDKVSELSDVFSAFQNAGTLNAKGEAAPSSPLSAGTDATEVSYSMEKGVFKRIGKITNQELLEKNVDSLGSMEMFLSSSTYTLKYHFPKKIKNVSVKGALFSDDRKTIIFKVPFMDYYKDPEALNIEVELEN